MVKRISSMKRELRLGLNYLTLTYQFFPVSQSLKSCFLWRKIWSCRRKIPFKIMILNEPTKSNSKWIASNHSLYHFMQISYFRNFSFPENWVTKLANDRTLDINNRLIAIENRKWRMSVEDEWPWKSRGREKVSCVHRVPSINFHIETVFVAPLGDRGSGRKHFQRGRRPAQKCDTRWPKWVAVQARCQREQTPRDSWDLEGLSHRHSSTTHWHLLSRTDRDL